MATIRTALWAFGGLTRASASSTSGMNLRLEPWDFFSSSSSHIPSYSQSSPFLSSVNNFSSMGNPTPSPAAAKTTPFSSPSFSRWHHSMFCSTLHHNSHLPFSSASRLYSTETSSSPPPEATSTSSSTPSNEASPTTPVSATTSPTSATKAPSSNKAIKKAAKAQAKAAKKAKTTEKPRNPQKLNIVKHKQPPSLPRELAYELPPQVPRVFRTSTQEWVDATNALGLQYPVRVIDPALQTPSGWTPPVGPPTDIPFAIARSSNNNLPIYRHLKNGKTRRITLIRHAKGDIATLIQELKKVVRGVAQRKYGETAKPVEIRHRVSGVIEIKGDYFADVSRWAKGLGF